MKKKAHKKQSTRPQSEVTQDTFGIIPVGDRVVIRPMTEEEMGTKTPSGIIIPDTASKEKTDRGVVVSVGLGKWNEDGNARMPLSVKIGDKVLFQWGEKVEYRGDDYYVVSESNILAIIK